MIEKTFCYQLLLFLCLSLFIPCVSAGETEISKGKTLFTQFCSACHLNTGEGKPGVAPNIRNRDFLAIADDKFIHDTIKKGRPGTAMPPWSMLNDGQIKSIIAYLRGMEVALPLKVELNKNLKVKGDPGKGAGTFKVYCSSCHGPNGEGYAAGGSGPGIGLKGFLDTACDDYILKTALHGRSETAMRSMVGAKGLVNLTIQDIKDVIVFLRNTTVENRSQASPEVTNADPAKGKVLYDSNCMACHQPGGVGKPGFAPSIRNQDFLALASDDFIRKTLKKGRLGTSMVPRPDLSDADVNHIIAYLRDIEKGNVIRAKVDPEKKYRDGDLKVGQKKYENFCASCHGSNGQGYAAGGPGPAIGLKGFLEVASDDFIYQTVKNGRVGTAMKPFIGPKGVANLNKKDVVDIITYLRSL